MIPFVGTFVGAAIAIGSVVDVMFGIPRIPAILIGGGIVVLYSVIGGMWSLTLTDIVQFLIMTVGIFLILLPLAIGQAGGLEGMQAALPASYFDLGAIGFDRMCAMLTGAESIRDVIAFPKTTSASDLMTASPNAVDDRQLRDLHLAILEASPRSSTT